LVALATSHSYGAFSSVGASTGHYVLVQTIQPAGYTNLSDGDISDDGDQVANVNTTDDIIPLTLEQNISGGDPGGDIGNIFVEIAQPATISGYVFDDADNDQQWDSGEGLAGVKIRRFADTNEDGVADFPNSPLDSVFTNSTGFYSFVVSAGKYVIIEQHPVNYDNVMDLGSTGTGDLNDANNTNTTDDIIPIEVIPGETDANNRFIEEFACSRLVVNTNNSGIGSLRYNIDCAIDGDTIRFHQDLAGDTIRLSSIIAIEKNLVILSDVTPRIYIESETAGLFEIGAGKEIEFINLNMISGNSGVPAALDVLGELFLEDVEVFRNPDLVPGAILILGNNAATITVRGDVQVHDE
jgi:hypothetical protein